MLDILLLVEKIGKPVVIPLVYQFTLLPQNTFFLMNAT